MKADKNDILTRVKTLTRLYTDAFFGTSNSIEYKDNLVKELHQYSNGIHVVLARIESDAYKKNIFSDEELCHIIQGYFDNDDSPELVQPILRIVKAYHKSLVRKIILTKEAYMPLIDVIRFVDEWC